MAIPPEPNRISTHCFIISDQTRFFLCRHCRTPVVEYYNCRGLLQQEVDGLFCNYAFNVKIHDAVLRFFYNLPINNVRCNHCRKHIGVKFIVAGDRDPPFLSTLQGRFFFYSERLLYWDGSRCEYIDTGFGEQITRLLVFDGFRLIYFGAPYESTDEEDLS